MLKNLLNMREECRREIESVCVSYGYVKDKNKSSPNSLCYKFGNYSVVLNKRKQRFFLINSNIKGDVYDFVMFMESCSFKDAINILLNGRLNVIEKVFPKKDKNEDLNCFVLLESKKWFLPNENDKSSKYLNSRGINYDVIKSKRFFSSVLQDSKGNCVFPHTYNGNLIGADKKSNYYKGFTSGGKKSIWSSRISRNDMFCVITESPIDAISFSILFNTKYCFFVSICGGYSDMSIKAIKSIERNRNIKFITAFDNDDAGEMFYKKFRSILKQEPINIKPIGKDFNEDLCIKFKILMRNLN